MLSSLYLCLLEARLSCCVPMLGLPPGAGRAPEPAGGDQRGHAGLPAGVLPEGSAAAPGRGRAAAAPLGAAPPRHAARQLEPHRRAQGARGAHRCARLRVRRRGANPAGAPRPHVQGCGSTPEFVQQQVVVQKGGATVRSHCQQVRRGGKQWQLSQSSAPAQVEADGAAVGPLGMDEGAARAAGGLPGGIADSATEMGLARSSAHSSASAGSAVAVDIPARCALARPYPEVQSIALFHLGACTWRLRGCNDALSIMLMLLFTLFDAKHPGCAEERLSEAAQLRGAWPQQRADLCQVVAAPLKHDHLPVQASPGGEADAGGLTTPAQRVEPPRSSAKKPRPPPLDRAVMEAPVSAFAQGPSPGPPSAAPSGGAPSAAANGPTDAPISPLSGLLTGLGSGGLGGGATGQVPPCPVRADAHMSRGPAGVQG